MKKPAALLRNTLVVLVIAAFITTTTTIGTTAAYAENDDLVFDQDGKQPIGESPLIETQQDHTLLHRIRRGFWDLFGSKSTTTTTTTTTAEPPPDEEELEDLNFENASRAEQNQSNDFGSSVVKKPAANLERLVRDSGEENEDPDEQ